jgi:hypothetical protein
LHLGLVKCFDTVESLGRQLGRQQQDLRSAEGELVE